MIEYVSIDENKLKGIEVGAFNGLYVNTLELSQNSIRALNASTFRGLRVITALNLKGNQLGDEGWCAVFDALRDNPQNKIKEWDLYNQGITPTIAKSLSFSF